MIARLPSRPTLPRALLLATALCLPLGACNDSSPETDATLHALASPSETYVVRGIIKAMPQPDDPRTQLRIHHEHIPDFKGKSGQVFVNPDGVPGMKAMEMAFDNFGPTVVLDDFHVGDKVEFELGISREPRTSMVILRMTKLPPDTPISFEDKVGPNPEP